MNNLIVSEIVNIREVLERFDKNGIRSIVTVRKNKFKAVVDEADIRRHLIEGGSIKDYIGDVKVPIKQLTLKNFSGIFSAKKIFEENRRIELIPDLAKDLRLNYIYTRENVKTYIPVSLPYISNLEKEYVSEAVNSTWVSSQGKFIEKFSKELGLFLGSKYVSLASNGTSAIELALLSLGVGAGDKVIVPNFTFAATANAVVRVGAEPILVDVERQSWNLDIALCQKALKENNVKCILAVEIYGNPIDAVRWSKFAKEHDALLVIDAAESFGAEFNGVRTCPSVDAYTYSFFGNKLITTGEGGAVSFRCAATRDKAEIIRSHGLTDKQRYFHAEIGANFRMTNLQAALGCAQMESLDDMLSRRKKIFQLYDKKLSKYSFESQCILKNASQAPWLYSTLLKKEKDIEIIKSGMQSFGVEIRSGFYPLHLQPPFKQFKIYKNGTSEILYGKMLTLPTYYELSDHQIGQICDTLNNLVNG